MKSLLLPLLFANAALATPSKLGKKPQMGKKTLSQAVDAF
jgi:hypothetical protein